MQELEKQLQLFETKMKSPSYETIIGELKQQQTQLYEEGYKKLLLTGTMNEINEIIEKYDDKELSVSIYDLYPRRYTHNKIPTYQKPAMSLVITKDSLIMFLKKTILELQNSKNTCEQAVLFFKRKIEEKKNQTPEELEEEIKEKKAEEYRRKEADHTRQMEGNRGGQKSRKKKVRRIKKNKMNSGGKGIPRKRGRKTKKGSR